MITLQRHTRGTLILLLITGLLMACSGIKSYQDLPEKNFIIHTKTDSGSFLTNVKASLDIYHVNRHCQESYAGTVRLDRDRVEVGIAPGKTSYLNFRFVSGGLLSNSNSQISYETLVRPRKEYRYDVKVRYMDDIYNVEIFEKRSSRAKEREVPAYPLHDCKKLNTK